MVIAWKLKAAHSFEMPPRPASEVRVQILLLLFFEVSVGALDT